MEDNKEGKLTDKQRSNREASNANLVPFKPGQSGNPGGRPAGKSITAELRKLIDSGTNAQDMALILYEMAKRMSPAQLSAFKELLDRTDGKVPDTHKIESDIPINLTFKLVKGE